MDIVSPGIAQGQLERLVGFLGSGLGIGFAVQVELGGGVEAVADREAQALAKGWRIVGFGMAKRIDNITIIGGGTAGWMAATFLISGLGRGADGL